jgi:hypothetical protein
VSTENTIKTITQAVNQGFDIKVNGLNVDTALSVYYDNTLVANTSLEPRNGKIGDAIITDKSGQARFVFYVKDSYDELIDKPESQFISTLNNDIGDKKLVVVDKSSITANNLPSNFKDISRCYAEVTVKKAFDIVFSDIKNYSGSKENVGTRKLTII